MGNHTFYFGDLPLLPSPVGRLSVWLDPSKNSRAVGYLVLLTKLLRVKLPGSS
jgi:hypothetical protein